MGQKNITVRATSYWRDSEDAAKNECNRLLDMKEQDEMAEQQRNGFFLVSGSYSSYSIDHDRSQDLYRCERSKSLRFEEYEARHFSISDSDWGQILEGEGSAESNARVVSTLTQNQRRSWSAFDTGDAEDALRPIRDAVTPLVPGSIKVRLIVELPVPLADFSLENLVFVSSDLTLAQEAETVGLPLSEEIKTFPINNCGGPVELTVEEEITWEHVNGYRISFSKQSRSSIEISGKLNFLDPTGNALGEVGAQVSHEVTLTESSEFTRTTREVRRRRITFQIKENTNGTAKFTLRTFVAQRQFEGTAVIDGDVVGRYAFNGRGVYRLSSLLPSPAARTIAIKGKYGNINSQEMSFDATDIKPCS